MKKQIILSSLLIFMFIGCTEEDITGETEDNITKPTLNTVDEGNYQNAPQEIDKARLIYLVNEARKVGRYCGDRFMKSADSVVWDEKIVESAQLHSDDMAKNKFFSHTGSDGTNAGDRLHEVHYSWQAVGENIAMGYPTPEAVMQGWLDSPGHCVNIMDEHFTQMGVATNGIYWTQVFAKPWIKYK